MGKIQLGTDLEALKIANQNLNSASTSGATKKERITQALVVNDRVIPKPGARIERSNPDYSLFLKTFEAASKASAPEIVEKYFASLQSSFDSSKPNSISKLQSNFTVALDGLTKEPNSSLAKNAALSSIKDLVSGLNSTSIRLSTTKTDAINELRSSANEVNNLLTRLDQVNKQILTAEQPALHYDERDNIIRELSQFATLKISHNDKGQALISLKGGVTLLDSSNIATLYCQQDDSSDAGARILASLKGCQDQDISSNIQNGKLGGLIKFTTVELPKLIKMADSYASVLAQTLNKAFNTGSSYAARSTYLSTNSFSKAATLNFAGETKFSVVDQDGLPIKSDAANDASYFRPMSFTPDNAKSLKDIMAQFNQRFNIDPTLPRTQLGNISDVKLHVSADGKLNLALLNNSMFDTTVQVVNVNLPGHPAVDIPYPDGGTTKIASGEYQLTKNLLEGLQANAGDNIEVTLRSIGADGTVRQDTLTFNAVALGGYAVAAHIPVPNPTGAQTINPRGSSIARMKLVDKDGREINDDSTEGQLIIESFGQGNIVFGDLLNTSSEKLGLAALLGLNDLIKGNTASTITIDDVLSSGDMLPTVALSPSEKQVTTQVNRGQRASATVEFNFAAGPINAGGSFSFLLEDAGLDILQENVDVAANITDINGVLDLLRSNPRINQVLDFSAAGNTLTITSKMPGTRFNYDDARDNGVSFRINTNGGGATAAINGAGAGAAVNGGLQNGTDDFQNENLDAHAFSISRNNYDVIKNLQQLIKTPNKLYNENGELIDFSLEAAQNMVADNYLASWATAQNTAESAKEAAKEIEVELQEKTGVNALESLMEAHDIQAHIAALMSIFQIMQQTQKNIQNAIAAAAA